jgi:hypothetical protein
MLLTCRKVLHFKRMPLKTGVLFLSSLSLTGIGREGIQFKKAATDFTIFA